MPWLKSVLPFSAESSITASHLRGNWNKQECPGLLHLSHSPTNVQWTSLNEPNTEGALLILASGWQWPAILPSLLNKITSAKRKKERSEKRILSGHTEKREARLPDSMEFLGRKDAWVCFVDGNPGWWTKTKSQNFSSGFHDSLSLALGDTVGLSFSQHTHAWQWGIWKCLCLNGPTCLQSPTVYLGRKWTCLDSPWGDTSAFTSLLSPWWAYWGGTGEWVLLGWRIRLPSRNTTESILQRW